MMRLLNEWLFNVSRYRTRIEVFQARVIYFITTVIVLLYTIYAVTVAEWSFAGEDRLLTMLEAALKYPSSPQGVVLFGMFAMGLLIYLLTRLGSRVVASWGVVMLWFAVGVVQITFNSLSPSAPGAAIVFLILVAGLLLNEPGVIFALLASAAMLVLRNISSPDYGLYPATDLSNMLLQLAGGTVAVYLLLRYIRLNRTEGVRKSVENRTTTAEIIRSIAQQVSNRASLEDLLNTIVSEINQRFDYIYHTQVFLSDDRRRNANLVASTGEVGRQLMAQQHSLPVGSESVIGQVTFSGVPLIARAGDEGSIHRINELLPDTAVEAAFPLRLGDNIIGALDIQSKDARAFDDPQLVATFQALADSVSLALDNVAQFEQAAAREAENRQLYQESEQTRREVERLNDLLTGEIWSEYLSDTQKGYSLEVDFVEDIGRTEIEWTSTLREAIQSGQLIRSQGSNTNLVAVPLQIRGQTIGAMEFELSDSQEFSPDDLTLIQEVSDRFGLAVENARLVDETLRVAQREALVNQISSRVQSSNDVNGMIAEAARSLLSALKADKVSIRLGAPPLAEKRRENGR